MSLSKEVALREICGNVMIFLLIQKTELQA